MDVERLRLDTPACKERIHLNNAGAALMPASVVNAVMEHIALESRIGGYEAADACREAIEAAYQSVASLINAAPRNIAFTENATASYVQALSSVPFEPGDTILTTRSDYASNQIQFLSLKSRIGVKVIRAPDHHTGGVDVSVMRDLIREQRPKIVCVTHVPTDSGLVQDVSAIGAICREAEVLYLVDACQSVGQLGVDVREIECDFLTCTSRKYLRGPRGAGFLFVSDRALNRGLEPLFIDMKGADWIGEDAYRPAADAKRFENWEFAWALVLGTAEAARYAQAIGVDKIEARVRSLAKQLREGLRATERVRVLDHGDRLCGIVSVWIDGFEPDVVVTTLRKRNINVSAQIREYAVLNYDDHGVPGAVRLSPHYYNTEHEIKEVVSAIQDVVGGST